MEGKQHAPDAAGCVTKTPIAYIVNIYACFVCRCVYTNVVQHKYENDMKRTIKYFTISILIILSVSCSKKTEVLKSKLLFDGNCCSGELFLYDNYTFMVSYTTFSDDWGSSLKGDYRIEGSEIILEGSEILHQNESLTVTEVGDLFTNKYQFKNEFLVPVQSLYSDLEISYIDKGFFRLPCGFETTEKNGSFEMFLFNFCDSLLELDSIDMDKLGFDPLPHVNSCNVRLAIPKDIKLLKAERFVNIYPTIWSRHADNITQFMQLDELVYKSKRGLICKNNTFFYPEIEISKSILNEFDEINHTVLEDAVLKQLNSEEIYSNERKKWLAYVAEFKNKDFYVQTNDLFRVNYHEIYIVIQLDVDGEIVDKVLWTKSYYGN